MKWPGGNANYCLVQQLWEKPNAAQVSTCANKGLTSGSFTSLRKAAKHVKGSFVRMLYLQKVYNKVLM